MSVNLNNLCSCFKCLDTWSPEHRILMDETLSNSVELPIETVVHYNEWFDPSNFNKAPTFFVSSPFLCQISILFKINGKCSCIWQCRSLFIQFFKWQKASFITIASNFGAKRTNALTRSEYSYSNCRYSRLVNVLALFWKKKEWPEHWKKKIRITFDNCNKLKNFILCFILFRRATLLIHTQNKYCSSITKMTHNRRQGTQWLSHYEETKYFRGFQTLPKPMKDKKKLG